jgi:hypothetical protein
MLPSSARVRLVRLRMIYSATVGAGSRKSATIHRIQVMEARNWCSDTNSPYHGRYHQEDSTGTVQPFPVVISLTLVFLDLDSF